MTQDTRTSLAVAAAVAIMVSGWGDVTRDAVGLVLAVAAALVVVGVGVAARGPRLSEATVVSLQGFAVLGSVAALVAVPSGPGEILRIGAIVQDGLAAARSGAAPLPATQGLAVLLVGGVAAMAWLMDALAVAARRPALVVLPLLGLFLVPALGLPGRVDFAMTIRLALALVAVLLAAVPRTVGRRSAAPARSGGLAVAAAVTAGALAFAWLVGGWVPLAPPPQLSNEPIQMTDPSQDLQRNLTTTTALPVLTYATDAPGGTYLKLATLTKFDAAGFGLDTVRVTVGSHLPSAPGLTRPGPSRRTQIQMGAFASEWLPVPWAPRDVRAPGRWAYAAETHDVMAMGPTRQSATLGIAYDVTSTEIRPSDEEIAAASVTLTPELTALTDVPGALPDRVRALARQVTASAPTPGAKALALQAFLRSDEFRYSTSRASGDSMSTLEDFLLRSRAGYCEQFAGSMVAMARAVGLPARLVVGFTPGTPIDGRWQVTTHDMHAWPELWLDGWGWVAFEPTPSSGAPTATLAPVPPNDSPTATSAATRSAPAPTQAPEDEDGSPTPPAPTSPAESTPGPSTPPPAIAGAGWWLAGLALLAAAGLAVLPRLLRQRRRAARLAEHADARAAALAAWDEVRDTVADLGGTWPEGSPRYVAEALVPGWPDDATRGVRELALAVERALYDRPEAYEGPAAWGTTVRTVTDALAAGASRADAVRAVWWPGSLWRR